MCYAAPLAGAIVTTIAWGKTKDVKTWWLMLMLYGGALFGLIDHLWNGELFLISENIASDLLLGATITAAILIVWKATVFLSKRSPTLAGYINIK
ncbi:MAG: hypothetical protein V2A72_02170 [Candidatus Omnitrophota bacterium]